MSRVRQFAVKKICAKRFINLQAKRFIELSTPQNLRCRPYFKELQWSGGTSLLCATERKCSYRVAALGYPRTVLLTITAFYLPDWDTFRQRSDFVAELLRLRNHLAEFLGDADFTALHEKGSVDEIGQALGKYAINSFTITDADLMDLGCGIYLSGSVFDHSCSPNATKYFVGKDLCVFALRDIPSFDMVRGAQG